MRTVCHLEGGRFEVIGLHRQSTVLLDGLAVGVMVALASIQLVWADVTFHGPDQIRDLAAAFRLAQDGEWPLVGPPVLNMRYHLPPLFIELLALPLSVRGMEIDAFRLFGLMCVLAVCWLWWELRSAWGSKVAVAYVAVSVPAWTSLYTHSAWNPALALPLSTALAASVVRALRSGGFAWTAVVGLFGCLVQIHPSGLPLGLGLLVWFVRPPGIGLNRYACMGAVLFFLSMLPWLMRLVSNPGVDGGVQPLAGSEGAAGWAQTVWSRWMDFGRWADAWWLQVRAWQALQPASAWGTGFAMVGVVVVSMGCLLSVARPYAAPMMRHWALTVVLWWLIAIGFLAQGAFWHLDVILPWLGVLAAMGWGMWGQSQIKAFVFVISVAAASLVGSHWLLHRSFAERGRLDMDMSGLFFPALPVALNEDLPAVSFRSQSAFLAWRDGEGVCDDQVHGVHALLLHDLTNRSRVRDCAEEGLERPFNETLSGYALSVPVLDGNAGWQGLADPLVRLSGYTVQRFDPLVVHINDEATAQIVGQDRQNYMLVQPHAWPDSIRIRVKGIGAVQVRLGLKCERGTRLGDAAAWSLSARPILAGSPTSQVYRWLGYDYIDISWMFEDTPNLEWLEIQSPVGSVRCDVSVAAWNTHTLTAKKLINGTNVTTMAKPTR